MAKVVKGEREKRNGEIKEEVGDGGSWGSSTWQLLGGFDGEERVS